MFEQLITDKRSYEPSVLMLIQDGIKTVNL